MLRRILRPGDWVIYRKTKFSPSPGARAQDIHPAASGEDYAYCIDKFWVVLDVRPDGKILLGTRRGKQHVVEATSPNLRRPNLWERLVYRNRFREVQPPEASRPIEFVITGNQEASQVR